MILISATSATAPEDSIRVSSTVYLVAEDSKAEGFQEVTTAQADTAVPARTDLPPKHPLYGKRLLKIVPCGSLDIEITGGKAKQIRPDGTYLEEAPPKPTEKPISEVVEDDGRIG